MLTLTFGLRRKRIIQRKRTKFVRRLPEDPKERKIKNGISPQLKTAVNLTSFLLKSIKRPSLLPMHISTRYLQFRQSAGFGKIWTIEEIGTFGLHAGRGKKTFYRRVSMDILSWVILIPLRNLFVPVSPECLEKAPHILRSFLLDIRLLFFVKLIHPEATSYQYQ